MNIYPYVSYLKCKFHNWVKNSPIFLNQTKHIYLITIITKLCFVCRNIHGYSQISLVSFSSADGIFLMKNVRGSKKQYWQTHINYYSTRNWVYSRDAPRFSGFAQQHLQIIIFWTISTSCFRRNNCGFILWLAVFHSWQILQHVKVSQLLLTGKPENLDFTNSLIHPHPRNPSMIVSKTENTWNSRTIEHKL